MMNQQAKPRRKSQHGPIGPPKGPKAAAPAQFGIQQQSFVQQTYDTYPSSLAQDPMLVQQQQQQQQQQPSNEETHLPSFNPNNQSSEDLYEQLGLEIQRATSAPPMLELKSNNIFSFQSKYGHLFGDIRLEDDYADFYQQYSQQAKLPPPLEQTPLMWNYAAEKFANPDETFSPTFQSMQHPAAAANHHHMHTNFVQNLEQAAVSFSTPEQAPLPTQHMTNWQLDENGEQEDEDEEEEEDNNAYHNHHYNSSISPPIKPQPSKPMPTTTTSPSLKKGTQQPTTTTTTTPKHQQQQPLSYSSVAAAPPVAAPVQASPAQQPTPRPPSPASSTTSSDDTPLKEGKKSKYASVTEVLGKIYGMAKDQHGCRFLQRKLEEGNTEDLDTIYAEVFSHIVELMTDPFGNYLCQKLLEHCNDKQKTSIISSVASSLVKISMNMHGTRAVQKLIECLTVPAHILKVIEALKNYVVPLIKDLNGNHVIQRCLQKLSYPDKQFIYDAVAGRCVEVATHKHGCCVLQRCIDYANEAQKMQLIREVTIHALHLVQNPFGNYVVQYVLDLGNDDVNSQVVSKFFGSITELSTNKFSSNVIEKCIRIVNIKVRNVIIAEISNSESLAHLIQDSFGNYVLQTSLAFSDPQQFQNLNDLIRPLLYLVRNTPYAKKIESKLNKKPTGVPAPVPIHIANSQSKQSSSPFQQQGNGGGRGKGGKK